MSILIKYTFWPHSLKGLTEYLELPATNYIEAKQKALKYVFLQRVNKHPPRGNKPSLWRIL